MADYTVSDKSSGDELTAAEYNQIKDVIKDNTRLLAGRDPVVDGTKLDGIEAGAEVNNISDANATDLTDAGDSVLHYHATDRDRTNHTGTQTVSTISDFDSNLAGKTNTTSFTPTADYHVSTKKYVDDKVVTPTEELTAGESLVNGNLCYLKSDGKMWKADASADTTCDTLLAMCLDTIAADATGTFQLFGQWTTTGLTAGSKYYVSETGGAITATAPATTGAIRRFIGYALSTTVLYINIDNTYIEVA